MLGSSVGIKNISKNFGHFKVLSDINLEIKKGEFFSLLGPSGCGKTTLLRMIAGFDKPDTGSIFLDDRNVTDIASNKRKVNTVFQNYAVFPHLTVFDNIAFGLKLKKIDKKIIQKEVFTFLELVKLNGQERKMPSQLSGGQKQRVAIARALINKPQVLLLDEPLSALDAKLRKELLIELDQIHNEIGITFIYVTHDQEEALGVSDRIAIMKDGKINQIGTSKEIYEKPADAFVAGFIGETNLLKGSLSITENKETKLITEKAGSINILINNPKIKSGASLTVSLRPEKINILPIEPTVKITHECLQGQVKEIVYSGFQSRYFVKTKQNIMNIIKVHEANETRIRRGDKVFLEWEKSDMNIVEFS
ncbi:MAG: spermidine/putrescine ABC transporter ATP-binding protein [Candidatus Margulisbacteria bacterium GWF2_35_9]|nr:MAG: spermidine/putrescine ABC transporter ATP-binding protein [Candidatus Margulisbacteria bacterium GWF2_35_9]